MFRASLRLDSIVVNVEITVNSEEDSVTEKEIKNAVQAALGVRREEIGFQTGFQNKTKRHRAVQSITISLPDTYRGDYNEKLRNFFYSR